MIQLSAGCCLQSTSMLNDTFFDGVIVYICEYNERGALGFIINQPFGKGLQELEEFKHIPAFPLYTGGPVDQEHLFFLHTRSDLIKEGTVLKAGIFYGGNFTEAVAAILNRNLSHHELKIFVGYCGWDAGELEEELREGSWKPVNIENIFLK